MRAHVHDPAGPFHSYWLPASPGLGIGVTACTADEALLLAGGALALLPPGAVLSEEIVEVGGGDPDDASALPAGIRASRVHGVWYPRG
jgi:hypothetical protein